MVWLFKRIFLTQPSREMRREGDFPSAPPVQYILYYTCTCQRGCCVGVLWIRVLWCATIRLAYHGDFCGNLHTTVSTWILWFLPGYFYFYLATTVSSWIMLFLPEYCTTVYSWVLLILTGYHCFYMDTIVSTWILLFPPRYYFF
jgi:hypothetical protein